MVIGFSLFTRNQQNVDVGVFVKFYVSYTLIVEDKKAKLTLVYFSSLAKLIIKWLIATTPKRLKKSAISCLINYYIVIKSALACFLIAQLKRKFLPL